MMADGWLGGHGSLFLSFAFPEVSAVKKLWNSTLKEVLKHRKKNKDPL